MAMKEMKQIQILNNVNPNVMQALEESVFYEENKLKIFPAYIWRNIDENILKIFMLKHGIYILPTTELIEWLKQNIIGRAIEIGSGNSAIARTLNIPITDSRLQEQPEIALYYESLGQPTIKYNDDVERLDAMEAIKKYNPDTVIGAFITHRFNPKTNSGNMYGVSEEAVLRKVKRYINIGNLETHHDKPIRKTHKHEEFYFEWIISRSADQSKNRIWIFNTNK